MCWLAELTGTALIRVVRQQQCDGQPPVRPVHRHLLRPQPVSRHLHRQGDAVRRLLPLVSATRSTKWSIETAIGTRLKGTERKHLPN